VKPLVAVLAALLALYPLRGSIAAPQDAVVTAAKSMKTAHRSRRHERSPHSIAIPDEFAPPQEAFASFAQIPTPPGSAAPPSDCDLRLATVAQFRRLPVLFGPGECGADDAVLLEGVTLLDHSKVTLSPPATLRCTMAEEVAQWLRQDVAPAVHKLGSKLHALEDAGSYECRGRNRVHAAMMSEHARANALDVRALGLADGKVIGLTDMNAPKEFRESLRESACAHFTTVLGPGSDAYHEEHVHLDLDQRRGGYRLCEWEVRTPPPPPAPPAPTAAAAPVQHAAAAVPVAVPIAQPVPLPLPRPPQADARIGSRRHRHHYRRWW